MKEQKDEVRDGEEAEELKGRNPKVSGFPPTGNRPSAVMERTDGGRDITLQLESSTAFNCLHTFTSRLGIC